MPIAGECFSTRIPIGGINLYARSTQMNSIIKAAPSGESPFDSIRHTEENGQECWYARELQKILGYKRWDKFLECIEQAIENIEFSSEDITKHISLKEGLGGSATLANPKISEEYKLSRFGCYHLVLACPGKGKPNVALAKQYFVAKTREAEIITAEAQVIAADNFDSLHSKQLSEIRDALTNPGSISTAEFAVLTDGISPALVAKIGALTNDQYVKLYLTLRNARVPQDIQDQKKAGVFTAAELKIADKTIERFDRLQKVADQKWQRAIGGTIQKALEG
jgi:hypothetical protein